MFSYNSHSLCFSPFRQVLLCALNVRALIICAPFLCSINLYAADIEVVEAQPSSVGVDAPLVQSRQSSTEPLSTTSSSTVSSSTVPSSTVYSTAANSSVNYRLDDRPSDTQTELLLQLQVLQSEMMQLRGLVEEQAHHIEQLQQRRLDDYVDLDRRIGELAKSGTTSSTTIDKPSISVNASSKPQIAAPVTVSQSAISNGVKSLAGVDSNRSVSAANPNIVVASSGSKNISVGNDLVGESKDTSGRSDDQGLEVYKAAYDKVKNRKFDEAKVDMVAFVGEYPNHSKAPNAYFWIGELYYHDSDMSESKKAFNVLVEDFPGHRKVPDAKFKLAKIFHQSGDSKQATALLESVVKEHSSSRVAKPAKEYLENSVR